MDEAEQFDSAKLARYARQMMLDRISESGQRRLLKATVAIVGCGGLGSTIGQILARAGVGTLVLCDSDEVEIENLHRQILYDERDVGRSKAVAAAARLLSINSQVKMHARPMRVDAENAAELFESSDLVVDATDNLASRYVLNAAAVRLKRDWIYGGCVGWEGTVMVVRSGTGGACLECVFGPPEPSDPATGGRFPISPATPVVVGSIEAHEVLRYLLDPAANKPCGSRYVCINLEHPRVRSNDGVPNNPACRACGGGKNLKSEI